MTRSELRASETVWRSRSLRDTVAKQQSRQSRIAATNNRHAPKWMKPADVKPVVRWPFIWTLYGVCCVKLIVTVFPL